MTFVSFLEHEDISKRSVGYAATLLGIVSFIPILYNIFVTRNTSNFTYKNLALALVSNLLWFYYGVDSSSYAPLISGVMYFLVYSIILYYKVFF